MPLSRITPMNQVMVEEMSQDWMEPDPRIMETNIEQLISTVEENKYMSYLNHYVVQGDQHFPMYHTMPINAKARNMNNMAQRPLIQCYKCNGPHKANVSTQGTSEETYLVLWMCGTSLL